MQTTDRASGTIAERLAAWALGLDYDDLPDDVVTAAKRLVLDQIGVQVRGSTLPHVQAVLRRVEAMGARGEATVTGTPLQTTAAEAAYVNGTFGASMEFDDAHVLLWHASSVLVPTAVALAEREGRGGRDVLLALVAGHQVMAAIGGITMPEILQRGWHGPKAFGGFAAATTAARILDLPEATLVNAFGIAGSDASGTMEYDQAGGEVKRLHTGSAARSGVEAVELATYGLTGPRTIFEGPRGFFQHFAGGKDTGSLDALLATWHIRDTMFRLTPGVGTVLPAVDLVSDLQSEHGIAWQDVAGVDVGLPAFAVGHGGHIVHPTDAVSAHFSLAFAIALRLVIGRSAPEDYVDPVRWSDPTIYQVSELVRPYAYDFDEGMPLLSAHVEIRLKDGRRLSRIQGGFRGSPSLPASEGDIVAKFHANVDGILTPDDAKTVLNTIQGLDHLEDVRQLTRHLSRAGTPVGLGT